VWRLWMIEATAAANDQWTESEGGGPTCRPTRCRNEHIEGIAAYCDHSVRVRALESISTTIKAVLRRVGACGMRRFRSKLKWSTARPIRSVRDVVRFLHPERVHSVR
jgi:hypothetical protein